MRIRPVTAMIGVLCVIGLTGCSSSNGSPGDGVKLQGAGASFPAPLYTKWFKSFSGSRPNVLVDYQSVGSGSGVKSVIDRTVDFGASDAAMSPEEMARVQGGVQLIPMTAGSIGIAYNLPDVKELKLSRKAYSGIFLGKIKKWNDPEIVQSNPGVKLPDTAVNVVVRADSSGTSFVFSKHLSAISPEFEKTIGTNKMPNWPVGTKSKGNEGVTAAIMTTPGSVGYIEYGYARSQNVPLAALENKAGKYISANTVSGQAALASAELPENLIVWNADPAAPDAYPIVTYTWQIFYKKYDAKKLAAIKDLIAYQLNDGQKDAEALGYIPLPPNVVAKGMAATSGIVSQ
ncbi:MAG: phosphate ABC transporter substrate-binding protein PstS [Acidobacteria bacterium]|nr:phosphate ABC transporter substrate-binding protein PstS [Acidobacteriota bacterium]